MHTITAQAMRRAEEIGEVLAKLFVALSLPAHRCVSRSDSLSFLHMFRIPGSALSKSITCLIQQLIGLWAGLMANIPTKRLQLGGRMRKLVLQMIAHQHCSRGLLLLRGIAESRGAQPHRVPLPSVPLCRGHDRWHQFRGCAGGTKQGSQRSKADPTARGRAGQSIKQGAGRA